MRSQVLKYASPNCAELERERASVLSALELLKLRHTMPPKPMSQVAGIAASRMALSNAEKVAL